LSVTFACCRAEKTGAVAVVMAKHSKTALQEFFVGSVTNYCERE
jgi:nucleotide-binding universal stress UspA family protein